MRAQQGPVRAATGSISSSWSSGSSLGIDRLWVATHCNWYMHVLWGLTVHMEAPLTVAGCSWHSKACCLLQGGYLPP
jgi:hypothetical protein